MATLDEILLQRSLILRGGRAQTQSNTPSPLTAQDVSEIKAILSQMGEVIFALNSAIGQTLFVTLNRTENNPRAFDDEDAQAVVRFVDLAVSPIVAGRLVVDVIFGDQPFGFARRVVLDLFDEVENNVIGMLVAEVSREDPMETNQLVGRFLTNAGENLGAIADMVDDLFRAGAGRLSIAADPSMTIQHDDIAVGYPGTSVFMLEALAGTRSTDVLDSHQSPLVTLMPVVPDVLRKAVETFLKAVSRVIGPKTQRGVTLQVQSKRAVMALARTTVVAARRLAQQPLIPSERVLFGGSRVFFNAWRLLESSENAAAVRMANQAAIHEFVIEPSSVGTAAMELYVLRLFQKASKVPGLRTEVSVFLSQLTNAAKAGLYPHRIAFQGGFTTRQGMEDLGKFLAEIPTDDLLKTNEVITSLINKAKRGQPGGKYYHRYSEILRATEALVIGKGIRIQQMAQIARSAKQGQALIKDELGRVLDAVPAIPVNKAIPTAQVAKVASSAMEVSTERAIDRAIRQLPSRADVLNRIKSELNVWRLQISKLVDFVQKERVDVQEVIDAVSLLDNAAIRVRREFELFRAATTDPAELRVLAHLENSFLKRVDQITARARTGLIDQIRRGEVPFNLLTAAVGAGIFLTGLTASEEALAQVRENPDSADAFMQNARTARITAELVDRFIGAEVFGEPEAVASIVAAANDVDEASNAVNGAIADGSKQDIEAALMRHRETVGNLGTVVGDQRENLTLTGEEWVDYLLQYAETDSFVTNNEGRSAIPEAQDVPEC